MKIMRLFILSIVILFVSGSTCYPSEKIVIRPPKVIKVPSDFSSINAAIENAAEYDIIEVAAGTYNETLVISKNNLRITGGGKDNTIITGNSASNVITVNRGNGFALEKITIQGGYIGVYCSWAGAALSECRIQNNIGDAGIVSTNGSIISLGQTDISGNNCGVMVLYNSVMRIENCNIFSNSLEGVSAWFLGVARIKSCDIYSNGGDGIQVGGGSSVRLSLSKVHGNALSGIGATEGSSARLGGGNDIYSNGDNSGWRAGIGVFHGSNVTATLTDSSEKDDIYLNNGPGLFISNNSSLFLKIGNVYQNKGDGIHLTLNSTAQLEEVSLTDNTGYGIACNQQSVLSKIGATIISGNTLGDTGGCW